MFTIISLALIGLKNSAPGGTLIPSGDTGAQAVAGRAAGAERCFHARRGLAYYPIVVDMWRSTMNITRLLLSPRAQGSTCDRARVLSKRWRQKAIVHRQEVKLWIERRTLDDPDHWKLAVSVAQKVYPGTFYWLMSCSASEGGWGRWVPNSQGAPPGGWLQFYESTFWRMFSSARADVRARGFRVPRSAASWYSPLGQALAGAWGLTHGRRGEWSGRGC